MELKQDDRNLLREFFGNQSDWMGNNSLRVLENLVELKRKFDEFVKSKKCEDNLACKIFVLTLEHEVLKCKERQLIQLYNKDINKNKIKKVELNYRPATNVATDNQSILNWIEESKISYVVPASHINSLDKSIQQKVGQNEKERRANYETIKNFIVH